MDLTLGPVQYFWSADTWSDFYAMIADEAPVDRVVLGELICSKRLPFFQDRIPDVVERLQAAGKAVSVTSLALVTLKRERKMTADLADLGLEVEVNDLTMLAYLPQGRGFSVGPLVNVYNEGTVDWLRGRGATRICLPPELPLEQVAALAPGAGLPLEVWGWGRLPLAISGRCYHARLHGRSKDNCQFVCGADPDGLPVDTLDGEKFLAVNGVQTLSAATACAGADIEALRRAGVGALRLSPQSRDMLPVIRAFRAALDGRIDRAEMVAAARRLAPQEHVANGYLHGVEGARWVDM